MLSSESLVEQLLTTDRVGTTRLLDWALAGIRAVDPRHLVNAALGDRLAVNGIPIEETSIVVLAVGKAAAAMAWGPEPPKRCRS